MILLVLATVLAADPTPKDAQALATLDVALLRREGAPTPHVLESALASFRRAPGHRLEVSPLPREAVAELTPETLEDVAPEISPVQRAEIATIHDATRLRFQWPLGEHSGLKEANELIAQVAAAQAAWIFDLDAIVVMSADSWKERRLRNWAGSLPLAGDQYIVHIVPEKQGTMMLQTAGLARFGFPPLVVPGVGRTAVDSVGNLINALVQEMAERGSPGPGMLYCLALEELKHPVARSRALSDLAPKASKTLVVYLRPLSLRPGAPREVMFSPELAGSRGERLDKALVTLFGAEDTPHLIEHSEAVTAASEHARKELRSVYKPKFLAGLPGRDALMVKAPFSYPNGQEWMWIEVTGWKGDRVEGRLSNDPQYVKSLAAGAGVEIREKEIFDFMYKLEDGSFYGNETGRVTHPELFNSLGTGRFSFRK